MEDKIQVINKRGMVGKRGESRSKMKGNKKIMARRKKRKFVKGAWKKVGCEK